MSSDVIFSADGTLTSLDIDFKYNGTCVNFKDSPEDSLIAETS